MKLITIKKLSEFINVKEPTIYSWVNIGSIPFYKLNGVLRFDLDEIKEWIKQTRKVPTDNTLKPKPINQNKLNNIVRKSIEEVNGKGYNFSQQETNLKARSRKGEVDGNL